MSRSSSRRFAVCRTGLWTLGSLFMMAAVCEQSLAAPRRWLDAEVAYLLDYVATALDHDVALRSHPVSLGRISSDDYPDSQYATELRRRVESRLKTRLTSDGLFTLTINYDVVDSSHDVAIGTPSAKKLKVLLISAIIKDRTGREMLHRSVEVNDTADIARVMALTVAPPFFGDHAARNRVIEDAHGRNRGRPPELVQACFQVRDETKVGIIGDDKFFVEIRIKDFPDGMSRPATPRPDQHGNAFVEIGNNQTFEVAVYNDDKFDCLTSIWFNGGDTLNSRNTDGVEYPGLLVSTTHSRVANGWLISARRPSASYGAFDASMPGAIVVQFAVAYRPEERRPRLLNYFREASLILDESFVPVNLIVGEFNETISIRLNPLAK